MPNQTGSSCRKLPENTILFLEGDPGDEMFIIKSGEVKILKREGPRSVELARLGPGSVLGEMSLLDGDSRSATARTTMDSEVVVVNRELLEKSYSKVPSWLEALVRMLVQRLRNTMARKYRRDITESLPAFLKTLLWIKNGTLPRRHNIRDGIPLALIQQELHTFYGLQSQESVKVAKLLEEIEVLEVKVHPKLGKVLQVNSLRMVNDFLRFLEAQNEGQKLPEEMVTDRGMKLLQVLVVAAEKRGTKSEHSSRIPVKQLETYMENEKTDPPTLDRNILDDIANLGFLVYEKKRVETRHQGHSADVISYKNNDLTALFHFREHLPAFRKDFAESL